MKIQLIFPPIDESYGGNSLTAWRSPPSGLAQLAKAAEFSGVPRKDIEILDGNFLSLNEIVDRLEPGLTGITTWYNNANNKRKIAKAAKKKRSLVVVGGHDVNEVTAQRMLDNNNSIDFAVKGKGISVMPFIIKEAEKYFRSGRIQKGVLDGSQFSELWERSMLFDFEALDWTKYLDQEYTQIAVDGIRGCIKAERQERCSYCSIEDRLSVRDPRQVWGQVALINGMYGFDFFFETGDTIMVGNYVQRLLETRPNGLEHIKWRIYTGADELEPCVIDMFEKLNVEQLFIGVESHDNAVLKANNRSNTEEDNERAVSMAIGGPWELHLSAHYSSRGESEESMRKTYDFLERTKEKHGEKMFVVAGPTIPLAGSADFSWLANNSEARSRYSGDLKKDDVFDYEELTKLKVDLMTDTSYESVQHYVQKTMELMGKNRAPGFGVNK